MSPDPTLYKRTRRAKLPADLQAAPLRELFWSRPETTLFAEAMQRLASVLDAAEAPEQFQLFDDLYESPAC